MSKTYKTFFIYGCNDIACINFPFMPLYDILFCFMLHPSIVQHFHYNSIKVSSISYLYWDHFLFNYYFAFNSHVAFYDGRLYDIDISIRFILISIFATLILAIIPVRAIV